MANFDEVKCSMIQHGWCSHQPDRWSRFLSLEHLRYLSEINRSTFNHNSHSRCGEAEWCIANQVNSNNYVTRHVRADCDCQMIGVPIKDVADIIVHGGVPLVSIKTDKKTGQLTLRVKRRTLFSRYTAISHVWSDGLGNFCDNKLPLCQLQRLRGYLEKLPPSLSGTVEQFDSPFTSLYSRIFLGKSNVFWMDTLCIPNGVASDGLKMRAIKRMATTYAAAAQVLVLDAELQQHQIQGSPENEVLARIIGSNWMSRSWTFQEGALGVNVFFQFKDTTFYPIPKWCKAEVDHAPKRGVNSPSIGSSDETINSALYNVLWMQLRHDWKSYTTVGRISNDSTLSLRFLQSCQDLMSSSWRSNRAYKRKTTYDEGRVPQLVEMWNEFGYRATSMAEDTHIIIANLLDLYSHDVMGLSTKIERMQAMLLSFEFLPLSLFYNTGPRCEDLQNRWLPIEPSKSLMVCHPLLQRSPDGYRLLDSKGPDCRPLILLTNSNIAGKGTFYVKATGQVENFHACVSCEEKHIAPPPGTISSCILIERNSEASSYDLSRGALLWVTDIRNGPDSVEELRTMYCCPVQIRKPSPTPESQGGR
ncbi:MAG: hypothetical protein M1820_006754 [Bogoriella megaspora]|nr:MAG: hypothetical protein M1820_006754 [Bogoriella megaspora]